MRGVEKLIASGGGTASAVAAKLHTEQRPCSRQLVEYWLKRGYVTGTWAPEVHRVFGIALHELNPAMYPKDLASSVPAVLAGAPNSAAA